MDIEKQVQKAASLIARLREVDVDFRVFGADMHKYRLGPILSEDELWSFEREHKIELPPDYRLYLKTVGNGNGKLPDKLWGTLGTAGVGPDYGLYRLQDTLLGKRTNEPFPFTEVTELDSELADLWDMDIPGLLDIGSKGCAYSTHLCVGGPAYGKVWDASDYSYFESTGLSFAEWVCDWAERAIPRVIRERVTRPVRVGMTVKAVVRICGDGGQRSYSLDDLPLQMRFLRFEGLATEFEVDEHNIVVRIINHSV